VSGTSTGSPSPPTWLAGTTTPSAVSIEPTSVEPKPVASEFFNFSNLSASTLDMANSTMNIHISTVTMSM